MRTLHDQNNKTVIVTEIINSQKILSLSITVVLIYPFILGVTLPLCSLLHFVLSKHSLWLVVQSWSHLLTNVSNISDVSIYSLIYLEISSVSDKYYFCFWVTVKHFTCRIWLNRTMDGEDSYRTRDCGITTFIADWLWPSILSCPILYVNFRYKNTLI